jgi:maltose O-acetyltransferase
MGDFAHRVTDCLLASELMPASIRMKLMRWLGYDVSPEACIWAGANLRSKNLSIGPGVFINIGFFFDGFARLEIGDNVRVGQNVKIITATHEIGPSTQRGLIEVVGGPVTIKRGCWIGAGTTIMPRVTIAEGCVIGVNSLVNKSTEPDGLYVGTPARRVRDLGP